MTLGKEFFEQLDPKYVAPEYKFMAHLKVDTLKIDVRVESNQREQIEDIISGWIMDYKADWKNPEIDKVQETTTWKDKTVTITCNFIQDEA